MPVTAQASGPLYFKVGSVSGGAGNVTTAILNDTDYTGRIYIHAFSLFADGTTSATLKSASTSISAAIPLVANGGAIYPFSEKGWCCQLTSTDDIGINVSAASVNVLYHVVYSLTGNISAGT